VQEKSKVADIIGITIADITTFGWSDDGRHVWITHRLRDGSEYRLIYPYESVDHLLILLTHATQSASSRRAAENSREAAEGMDSNVIPIAEVRVGTSPDESGAILHLTTSDSVPMVLELPIALGADLAEQLRCLLDRLQGTVGQRRSLH
jgi:hypothetical protein